MSEFQNINLDSISAEEREYYFKELFTVYEKDVPNSLSFLKNQQIIMNAIILPKETGTIRKLNGVPGKVKMFIPNSKFLKRIIRFLELYGLGRINLLTLNSIQITQLIIKTNTPLRIPARARHTSML